MKVFLMFFHTLRVHQNVINVNNDRLVWLWHEHRVYEVHELCQCVGQPKSHYLILIEAVSSGEGYLRYIFGTNLDLMISRVEINLGEHLSSR
jgi:hypothetical protein